MVKHVNETEFMSEVLNEEGVVVVDFFANWCGPCKMLAPILEELDNEMEEIKVVKVDIDQNPAIANHYGIQSIPTIKIFKNGKNVTTKVGFLPKGALERNIQKYV